ncbi:CocE/NonD family hydrolase [Leucobacter massiliensis]|uniref:Xaa-Pro dipeptidyl-peptidase C-terminal domain-containing protein n=1 Tax=Leucobacter massiliensis TaxID=1686285 RepID=A0A2S9QNN4_9MICO|nr:CocE/NonD family hydrolase [Leucobacter massiliensis]PRI11186.1 hypothetical protein B4915_10050 [Leucobacter massiliensis]
MAGPEMGEEVRVASTRLVESGVEMTASDGTVLRSVVHRMADREQGPVALVRNPYGEPLTRGLPIWALLEAGFAVVIQDCRGTAASDGEFVPFENEERDTVEAVEWCAALPYSNGVVVMYGASYSGMVQLAAAVNRPAGLAGIIPVVAPDDYQTRLAYRGGAFQLGQLTGWYTMKTIQSLQYRAQHGEPLGELMPRFGAHAADPWASVGSGALIDAPVLSEVLPTWRRWIEHDTTGDYWPALSYRDRRSRIAVPALHIGGWFDLFLGGTVANFAHLAEHAATPEARAGQRLILGPWQHIDQSGVIGDLSFGASASAAGIGLEQRVAEFAAAAAAGREIPGPPVRVYVMNAGRWREDTRWPLTGTAFTPWYLQPGGALAPEPAPADGGESGYVHDPADPVPMRGGQSGIFAGGVDGGSEWAPGPRDQRPLDDRDDVLRFVGEPLEAPVEAVGPVRAIVFAASTAEDTDFVARLIDVHPDGRAIGIVDGVVRAKFRNGQNRAEPVEPGRVCEYEIDLWATGWLFRPGHRIRVDVCSSSFPNWDVNSGRSGNHGEIAPSERVPATQRILHDAEHPSRIILPLVPSPS